MKRVKLALLSLAALSLFASQSIAQTQVTIGTQTNTQRQPLGSYWGFERSAAIYESGDIGRSGTIEKLSWYVTSANTGSHGIRIYLKHTTADNYTSASTWANKTAGAKLVYVDSNHVTTSGGWYEFTLDDTFTYYNSENLEVLVECNTGGTGIGNNTNVHFTNSSLGNTHQYWNADNNPPTGTGTREDDRPNLRIGFVPVPDIRVSQFLSSGMDCGLSSYDLEFRIENSGATTITNGSYIRYSYSLNNGTPVVDSFQLNADLPMSSTIDRTINGINVNSVVNADFKVWVHVDGDMLPSNDTNTHSLLNANCISANTSNDFESGDGDWTFNNVWSYGAINKGVLSNPPSGTQGWITNSVGNYPVNANAWLVSPVLNFSNSCSPIFRWKMRFETENNYDGMIVEVTTDNVNWTKVTTITPGYNNNSNFGPLTAPKFSGDNNSWTNYVLDLNAYAGEDAVRIRFRFGSDGSVTDPGVAIDDVEYQFTPNYNGIAFTAPDTVFINSLYDTEITSTSQTQTGVSFIWELDGMQVGTDRDLNYTFTSTGTFTLTQKAVDPCNVVLDSMNHTVVVINPSNAPEADFVADKNRVAQFETVTMTNLSTNGPTGYQWTIDPPFYTDPVTQLQLPSVSYDNNTSEFSKTPQMSFFGNGIYEICLIAENGVGRDTTCKSAYIEVGGGGGAAFGTDSIMCSGTGVNVSAKESGKVFDSGGPNGNYADNDNCTFIIDFSEYDSLYLQFNAFNVEQGWDFMWIYDGDENTGTPLYNTGTYPNGMTGTNIPTLQPATSGRVTIVFESDFVINEPGFELQYEAGNKIDTLIADFNVPDTLCATYPFSFQDASTYAKSYEWDFFGNGSVNSTEANPQFTYSTGGTYNVRLIVRNHTGADTMIKTIVVTNPGSNIVAFASPYTTYTVNDVVEIFDQTNGCVEDYEWRITPDRATFLNGSKFRSVAEVQFDTAGVYTITLLTTNAAGTDSLVRTSYITVTDICQPMLGTQIADMGISRVVFGDLDNSSAGDEGYTDYGNLGTEMMKGQVYDLELYRPTTSNEVGQRVWVDWNADGDFDDVGELIADASPSRNSSFTSSIRIPRTAINGQVTMRVSSSYHSQMNDPCGSRTYGETEDYRLVLFQDAIIPVITLNGADTITINRLDSYTELGATATDNLDGNLTPFIQLNSTVDTAVAGTYTVEYDVTDTAGNQAVTVTRTIIVLPDAPTLSLIGSAVDTIEVYSSYTDMRADAFDFNNNQIGISVNSNLDTAMVGTYTITYTATDQNGRSNSISRTVVVLDRTAPTGNLIGMDTLTVEVFSSLQDPGIDMSDNYCTNGNSYSASNVDLSTLGFKTLTYTLEDCYGNTSTITRVIEVVDTEAPEIELIGALSANVIRLRTYNDSGYTVNDNYYPEAQINIDVITNLANTESIGLYTMQYRATDGSGNSSMSQVRFIYVIDNVGIEDIISQEMKVYPNPNQGQFTIESEAFNGADVEYFLTDAQGKVVSQEKWQGFSGSRQLDISSLPAGVYFIRLQNGNHQAMSRVIINK